jgi:protein RecA
MLSKKMDVKHIEKSKAETPKGPVMGMAKVKTPTGMVTPYNSIHESAKTLFATLMKNEILNPGFAHFAPMEEAPPPRQFISTLLPPLDKMLGGGIPLGNFGEIFGKNGSGKSTLAYNIGVAFQRAGGYVFSIDSEHSWDVERFKQTGGDLGSLIYSEVDTLEQTFALLIATLNNQAKAKDQTPCLIIVDTVAATPLAAEQNAILSGEVFNDAYGGGRAKYLSQQMRQLPRLVGQCKTSILFLNQVRQKMSVMPFQDPYDVPGGEAVKHYASFRLKVQMIGKIKNGDKVVGQKVRFETVKCKTAPPFQRADLDLLYESGTFDTLASTLLSLKEQKLFKKTSAGFKVSEKLQSMGFADAYATEAEFRSAVVANMSALVPLIGSPEKADLTEEVDDGENGKSD